MDKLLATAERSCALRKIRYDTWARVCATYRHVNVLKINDQWRHGWFALPVHVTTTRLTAHGSSTCGPHGRIRTYRVGKTRTSSASSISANFFSLKPRQILSSHSRIYCVSSRHTSEKGFSREKSSSSKRLRDSSPLHRISQSIIPLIIWSSSQLQMDDLRCSPMSEKLPEKI